MNSRVLALCFLLVLTLAAMIALRRIFDHGAPVPGAPSAQSGPIAVLGEIPPFSLASHSGVKLGRSELTGKVWAANFIFTRCAATCPMQTYRMGQLQKSLADARGWSDIRLVSFSVDPEHDTVEVLSEYAAQAGAQAGQWHFLTGARDEIWQLSTNGFKLAVGEPPPDAGSPLFHSPMLVVVDRRGRIRGYFDGMTGDGITEAAAAMRKILSSPN